MKILVTGAAGFIGSHLVERLLTDGHEVVGYDNFDSFLYSAEAKQRNAAEIRARFPGFELVPGDLLAHEHVADLCQGKDLVVHLAALAGVRPSLRDPIRYARANVEGTVSVLEGCRAAGVQRLVFASSSSVYGARSPSDVPFREDDPCLVAASPYAATKRAAELVCRTYRDLYGIGVVSLRFFTVYGPRQRPEMAIHKFTGALAAGRPVTLFGDGSSARDYTYIDDIIEGVVAACERVGPGDCRIYNLGGSHTTELRELVTLIAGALDVPLKITWEPDQPGDVPITYADVTRAGIDLGYTPRVGIHEGISRFVAWFRDQGRPIP